jgi:glyoxylase-like metal-dependent hydrolase (beta-lactamase superfamily II)
MLTLQSFTFNAFAENTYLLTNELRQCWIIDPGMQSAAERAAFTGYIDKAGLKPVAIINTHAHIDHILGVAAMIEQYRIPFLLHEKELPVLAAGRGAAVMFGIPFDGAPQPTGFLREGEPLMLGEDTLTLLHVPGHSPGSIVFYSAAEGWAVAGDTLFAGSIGRTDLPGGNHETLMAAIPAQLFTLPDETVVYPGHGPSTTIGDEKRSNPFFRN